MQQFFATPKYDKKSIYKNPKTQYYYFTNTFGYYHMIKAGNPLYPKKNLCTEAIEIREYLTTPIPIQSYVFYLFCNSNQVSSVQETISMSSIMIVVDKMISKNAVAQKKSLAIKKENAKKLVELEAIYEATKESKKISILKYNAAYQAKSNAKKLKKLYKNQKVVVYNSLGQPPLLFDYPGLYKHIHDCIEFEKAHSKQRHEIIKARMISHLRSALEIKYNEYLLRTTLNNYLLPRNSSSIVARAHHHPALVAITNVSKSEKKEHTDEHYCLASVKGVRQFAAMFLHHSVVISQDDKVKVLLGILAVGKTFQTMQTIHKTVILADHDFPIGAYQKLIPFVYLAIDPLDSNDTLRKSQLGIFVCPQYNIGTSFNTHMANLIKLTNQESFTNIFKNNNQPITPVKQAMCILSGKLAGITLLIDIFGSHLDSQDKNVMTQYVEDNLPSFQIEDNEKDLNIRKCDDLTCCHPKRHKESAAFLAENNKFLPPVLKSWNGHYLNSVHILQYADILKLPAYDAHCLSISSEMHHRFCCTFCGKYFPMLKIVTTHKKSKHMKQKKHKHTTLSNSLDDFSLNLTSTTPELTIMTVF
ncbi:5823_t:CDS:2 [Cetraspora pellucida]|uniref:5823_t:CDS:1 n=1 Tax=Cetraspora pellucida TaxID=1433469 RepID=A0A9N9F222_9GLOM|nr:5823_t:CDS:2 [Cetraspora pellucida]